MIHYTLKCLTCHYEFDVWFKNSEEYEKQKKSDLIECPTCRSTNVDKSIMAPHVARKSTNKTLVIEWVGERFADEVCEMHEKKEWRNVFGLVTEDDLEKIKEKGIPVVDLSEKKNSH